MTEQTAKKLAKIRTEVDRMLADHPPKPSREPDATTSIYGLICLVVGAAFGSIGSFLIWWMMGLVHVTIAY